MLRLANDMPVDEFLARCWQKQVLACPGGLERDLPHISGEELAWLATQPDVESRIVYTQLDDPDEPYRLVNGPFADDELATLPDRNWTLLVQDVEKHLPELRRWIGAVAFVPDWRVDDVMVSFAAPGGGVGPHRDNYDVFLCQTDGQREWRLAPGIDGIGARHSGQLSLLQDFHDPEPTIAKPGHVLYLPPGVPHWGVATDACMTWSIGMRAPTARELHLAWEREFPDQASPFVNDESFFTDVGREPAGSIGEITAADVRRCRVLCRPDVNASDAELAKALGATVTDLKAWLAPEAAANDEIRALMEAPAVTLPVHGMSRLAFFEQEGCMLTFVNGASRVAGPGELRIFREICQKRELVPGALESCPAMLGWMLENGAFDSTAEFTEKA